MSGQTGSVTTDLDLASLRDLAIAVAGEAAELLVAGVQRARASVDTKSSSTDMVSELDRASEALILDRLLSARPNDGLLGEEGADVTGTSGLRWVVDPLDGTTNYLYGYPLWNVSIGAELDGVPVVGVVAVPSQHELYAAAAGLGATCNGNRLQVTTPPPIATSLVGTGFGYDPAMRAAQARTLARIIPRVRDIRRGGAAAADLCMLSQGRLDAYYEWGLNPWDRCAGAVVAGEAGIRVEVVATDPHGGTLTVGAHHDRWDEFCALLEDLGATDPH